jgi:hypothetical protein
LRAELVKRPLVVAAEPFAEDLGEQVPEGRQSSAFAVSYQAPDRTLTDATAGGAGFSPLRFVSADARLLVAATAEGLLAEDPQAHA